MRPVNLNGTHHSKAPFLEATVILLLLLLTAVALLVLWRVRAFRAIFENSEGLTPEALIGSVKLAGAGGFVLLATLALWAKHYAASTVTWQDPRFDSMTFLALAPVKALAALALWIVIVAIGTTTWQVLDNILANRPAAKADIRLLAAILIALAFLFGGVLR